MEDHNIISFLIEKIFIMRHRVSFIDIPQKRNTRIARTCIHKWAEFVYLDEPFEAPINEKRRGGQKPFHV